MGEVNHTSRAHALLSASGASRWMNCAPSARLEEKFDESAESVFAKEGTLAHEFGDISLRYANGEIEKAVYSAELKKLRGDKLYTDEMEGQVAKYVDFCLEILAVSKKADPSTTMVVEERFDFSHLVPGGFGTGDNTVIGGGILDIIDLKYGKGIRVEADKNPQLMLYASGALQAFELMHDIHTVRMHIVQPRLDHISTFEMSVEDLLTWGDREVKPKAKKAHEGRGVQKAGDWCKWCKVKPMCATIAARNVKLAQHEFKDPHLLTEEHLLMVFKQIPMLVDWAASVKDYITKEANKGRVFPGYKIVEGRANRKWTDEKKVAGALLDNLFTADQFTTSKLKGISAVEKLVGKSNFYEMLGELVIKPQGAPTLVPESDPRPGKGIAQAKKDFED